MKYFWGILVALLVVVGLGLFADHMHRLETAPAAVKAKCAGERGSYYRTKYINCLRRNM
jgi:hypothetical protein